MFFERLKQGLSFYKRAVYGLIAVALGIVILEQFTNIDLWIEDYYYNPELKTFVWKNTWFAKELMHVYVKDFIIIGAVGLIAFLILDAFIKFSRIDALLRFRLRFVASASIIIPFVISTLKHRSMLHCPWDLTRYGGDAPFVRLLSQIPIGMQPGHCFPAGHASTGLWLAAICVFWLPDQPKMALRMFFAGLSVGFILGWVQQMRGAHFLFHTLWATWLASLMIVMMLIFTHFLYIQKNHLCRV
jgi:membrane-associated PAP2 superfamily phosphatase